MGFLRHRNLSSRRGVIHYERAGSFADPALAHRLDEFRLAIPWRVAPQQSPPPLHQLSELCDVQFQRSTRRPTSKRVRFDFFREATNRFRLDFS